MAKQQFNARLEEHVISTIERLADELGCSQASVVAQAVRLLAKREGVTIEAPKKQTEKRSEKKSE